MSELNDTVDVTISLAARPLTRPGFNTLLFLSMHRAWSDLIKYYEDAADMLDDGFSETDDAYLAAASYFKQKAKPKKLAVGRIKTDDAVTISVVTVDNASKYSLVIDGIGFDYTSDATATTNEIEAGLTTAVNSGYAITAASATNDTFTIAGNHKDSFRVGKQFRVTGSTNNNGTYTVESVALSGGSTVITVEEEVPSASGTMGNLLPKTAVTVTNSVVWDGKISVAPNVAATFFEVGVSANLRADFTIDATMTSALTDIEAVDKTGWYMAALAHQWETTESPAQADVQADLEEALADEIETRMKMLVIGSPDANIVNVAKASDDQVTGSIARRLQGKGYQNSFVLYSTQADNGLDQDGNEGANPDPYADVAWAGERLPYTPGTENWKFAQLTGVTSDDLTDTQRTNAKAKNANYYVPLTEDISVTGQGTVGDGSFIDLVRLSHALDNEIKLAVAEAFVNPKAPLAKVPFTAEGIAALEMAMRKALDKYTGANRGLASYEIDMPDIDDVSDTDKGNRVLDGVTFTAVASGALNSAVIKGYVTP